MTGASGLDRNGHPTALPSDGASRARLTGTASPAALAAAAARPTQLPAPRSGGGISTLAVLYGGALLLVDALMTSLAFVLAYYLRLGMETRAFPPVPPLSAYRGMLGVLVGTTIVIFALNRLYLPRRGVSRIDLLYQIFVSVSVSNIVALALNAFLYKGLDYPRLMVVYAWILAIVLVWVGRGVLDSVMRILRRRGLDPARVLIVGAGEPGHLIVEKIRNAPELGYQVVGFVDDDPPDETEYDGPPYLGPLAAIPGLIQEHTVSELIIALPSLSHQQLLEIVGSCGRARVNIKVLPDLFQIMASEVSTSELGGLPMLRIRDVTLRGWNLVLKRAMDIVVSATALVLLSPLMLLLALLVKLTSEGPVFYTQERVGLDGRPFQLIKFRSMRVDAEAEIGPVWAKPNDERTTRIGAFMRRYSLDELPQLINVLLGEMSLVGPRPERPFFVEQFSRVIPRYMD
ncbi:MAG TPA: exopolysaccharide biosynthesis polyprenyl glycosylphosphotransferase, partial [Chloroflexota bacterium]